MPKRPNWRKDKILMFVWPLGLKNRYIREEMISCGFNAVRHMIRKDRWPPGKRLNARNMKEWLTTRLVQYDMASNQGTPFRMLDTISVAYEQRWIQQFTLCSSKNSPTRQYHRGTCYKQKDLGWTRDWTLYFFDVLKDEGLLRRGDFYEPENEPLYRTFEPMEYADWANALIAAVKAEYRAMQNLNVLVDAKSLCRDRAAWRRLRKGRAAVFSYHLANPRMSGEALAVEHERRISDMELARVPRRKIVGNESTCGRWNTASDYLDYLKPALCSAGSMPLRWCCYYMVVGQRKHWSVPWTPRKQVAGWPRIKRTLREWVEG